MPYILAKRHRPTLAAMASANVLAAFDYDGTLAPISDRPDRAVMRATTRRLLAAVAARYPCAVISGRARADLARCLKGVGVAHLSGNHGLEPWGEHPGHAARVRRWVAELEARLRRFEGVTIEDKTFTVTIHYRHARPKNAAIVAIDRAVRALRGARVMGGNEAINVLPRGAVDKGDALVRARKLLRCDRAIYVGDDDTDEDAFARAADGTVLGVRVGLRQSSNAAYHLRSQLDIDAFLRTLIALRPA